jgi:23S rRNA pseudouridine1911/1915/1917 synthase
METHHLTVPSTAARQRLDRFLAGALPRFSRSRLQTLIREGLVTLNGQPAAPRAMVRSGDVVTWREPPPTKLANEPEEIALDVLFEDDDLVVINKPPGLVVHPGPGNRGGTLVNALLHRYPSLSGIGGKERPGIVHRLDKETSGCIVVARNDETHRALSAQFAARTVEKIYLALVRGILRQVRGTIDAAIGRHPKDRQRMSVSSRRGREAMTEYRVVQTGPNASMVECRLHSGRTHQIRVHLHHLGHPVLGDKVYGGKAAGDFPRQMLHAWKLGFNHPRTNEWKTFEAARPDDFSAAMKQLEL